MAQVTTKDGYILSLQRMPNKRSGQAAENPPVFLQHGLLMVRNPVTFILICGKINELLKWMGNCGGRMA